MKYINKAVTLAVLLSVSGMQAQIPCKECDSIVSMIDVKDMYWNRINQDILVNFSLDASKLNLKSNESILIVPSVVGNGKENNIAGIMLCGRRQYLMMKRTKRKELEKKGIKLLWFSKHAPNDGIYNYHNLIKEEQGEFMCDSIILSKYYIGCGNGLNLLGETGIQQYMAEKPYEVSPKLIYLQPNVESIKERSESGKAYLDFPVNRTEIYEDFRANRNELKVIRKSIEKVLYNEDIRICKIRIHGFASPEGSYKNNERLAKDRSIALKEYVKGLYDFDDEICEVSYTPEDWNGLDEYAQTGMSRIAKTLGPLLKDTRGMEPDRREYSIRKRLGITDYSFLRDSIYPKLRHSDYEINYIVKGFEPEEGKKYLKTRPALLSLQEMFLIAMTYEADSPEFKEVFDIAVRLYPDDPTANLNAANIELENKDYKKAGVYLQKAGDSPEAVYTRGLLHLMTDDFNQAEKYLNEAKKAGISIADYALEQLSKRKETIRE